MEDIEMYAALAVIGIGVVVWAIRKYRAIMADGKVTLGELIGLSRDVADKAEEVKEDVDEVIGE